MEEQWTLTLVFTWPQLDFPLTHVLYGAPNHELVILVPTFHIKHELVSHPAAVQLSPLGWIWQQDPFLSWFRWLTWQKVMSCVARFCWFRELDQLCSGSDLCHSWSNGAGGRGDVLGQEEKQWDLFLPALVSCLDWPCRTATHPHAGNFWDGLYLFDDCF